MDKVYLILACFGLILSQVNGVSIVNNVTVPSDALMNIFIDQIQKDQHFSNVSIESYKNYDTKKCIVGLQGIISKLPSLNALRFFDSWGKLPSGILYGHFNDLGNYDQCVRSSVDVNDAIDIVKGQYCLTSVPMVPGLNSAVSEYIAITIGICVPDTCDPKLVMYIFQKGTTNVLGGAFTGTRVHSCKVVAKPTFEAKNIIGIVIFSIVGVIMALSTIYDVLYNKFLQKKPKPLFIAFSVLTNGRKLFAINTTKSPKTIDCLAGIRVLSMAWIIYCHNYESFIGLPLINFIDLYEWTKTIGSMHVVMATVSVDSFLLLSGLLLAWVVFPQLDKTKGKLNVLWMYIHRYIRLTPPVAAVIIFYVSVVGYIGSGPLRERLDGATHNCEENWWTTILYISNYVRPDNSCITQTWYLDVDTQLYLLSPFILIPLWKWGRKFVPVMVLLSLLSIGCIIATYYKEGYTQFLGILEKNQGSLTYVPTHTRYSAWLVGVGLGYFMHRNKQKSFRLPMWMTLLGWIACFSIILAIVFGPYFSIRADRTTTIFEAAIYEALKRPSWALALSWIIFASHFGFGGIINSFLSHPLWQPFSRLTYSMYLIHMTVQSVTFGSFRTDAYFSSYQLILSFWYIFGISVLAAIVLTLSFEAPVLVLERALIAERKPNESQPQNGTSTVVLTNESSHKCA